MKKQFLLFCFLLSCNYVIAQAKHDYTWVLGYGEEFTDPNGIVVGGTIINFNTNPIDLSLASLPTGMPIGMISDVEGNLVAYSDGCRVVNKYHEIMVNGDTITAGGTYDIFCKQSEYPVFQSPLFLPAPLNSSKYYLFQIKLGDHTPWFPYQLLWSLIDAEAENGQGKVIKKDQFICEDTLTGYYITATRHANGRD